MTLAFRGMPSLLLPTPHNPGCERFKARAYLANRPAWRCRRLCILCNARSEEALKQDEERPAPEPESWSIDSPPGDSYAGWSFLDVGSKKNKFPGFLKVGAGIALAVGFALVSHAASRKGFSNVIAPGPVVQKTFASIQDTLAPPKALDEAEHKEEAQEDLALEVKADDGDAEDHGEEEPHGLTQPESTDSSTGQVSFSSDKDEDVSDEDVTSSAYATGAASTFASDEHAVEESSPHADKQSDTSQQGEHLPSPTELTAEVVSDALGFPSPAQPPECLESSQDAEAPVSGSSELEPVFESASAEAESNQLLPEFPDAESDQPLPESVTPESDRTLSDGTNPLPSQEPLVVVVSDIPTEKGYTLLLASVDIQATEGESIPEVEAARSEDVQSDTSSSVLPDSQQEVPSPPKVGATPVEDAADLNVSEAERLDSVATSPSPESEFWHFTSVGIPAPSTPFVLASGRIIVPAVVDNAQEQALAALQSLKVIEPGVAAGDICSRREYARWLVSANRTLARSSASKVLPAMYIEKVSELAFTDVSPNDPDFPFIQGLAEAGLIASRLSSSENEDVKFFPDSPLSRQDLVSWKLALDYHTLPEIQFEKLEEKTGFIDLEQIHKDARPAIAADISSGERSIIASAFGYTRRFQPQKPVTRGQAGIALVSGDATDVIMEELARLEAEKLAERAVAAEIAFEARVQQESNEFFQEELEQQKQAAAAAESLVQSLKTELDSLKAQREEEKAAILKEKASVEAAKESTSQTKSQLDSMMEQVSLERVRVVFERERLEKLLVEIEEEREAMSRLKSEMEVETKALLLARAWAEEEAKKARTHAKVLEEARKRWETQGIEVHVDKELDDINIPVPTWQFNGEKFELETKQQQANAPIRSIMVKAEEYKDKSVQLLQAAMSSSGGKLSDMKTQMISSMQQISSKAEQVRRNTFFVVTTRAKEMQKSASDMAAGLSSMVSENTHKLANGCKGSAEKLAQIFKP